MKSKLVVLFIVIFLAVAGCSGSKSGTPEEKIAAINSMLTQGYEMSENQRSNINKSVAEARKLISQGKAAEADKILKQTINTLELIAETDRFNKSE